MYPVIICVYFLPTFLNCIQITGEKEKKLQLWQTLRLYVNPRLSINLSPPLAVPPFTISYVTPLSL